MAQCCRDYERLRFTYTARGAEPTERHVEPHRLVPLGRRWYLVAWDLDRHDWRSFRLDRLQEPRSTAATFGARALPTADAAAFVKASIERQRDPYSVEAEVHAPADDVRERVGRWAEITAAGPDRCRLAMTADSLDWPAMALGGLGAEFTVLHPPELRDYLGEWSDRFARATAGRRRRQTAAVYPGFTD